MKKNSVIAPLTGSISPEILASSTSQFNPPGSNPAQCRHLPTLDAADPSGDIKSLGEIASMAELTLFL